MVDAFTFDDGASMRKFRSRAEMYDYMVENGHIIIEGSDAPLFKSHVDKKAEKGNEKAAAAKARLEA